MERERVDDEDWRADGGEVSGIAGETGEWEEREAPNAAWVSVKRFALAGRFRAPVLCSGWSLHHKSDHRLHLHLRYGMKISSLCSPHHSGKEP